MFNTSKFTAACAAVLLTATLATAQQPTTVTGTITCSNCSGSGVSVNEDVASANADPGTPAYFVRKATPANTSSNDGDYEAGQMNAGRLWVSAVIDSALPAGNNNIGDVDVASSALPTGASTSAKQDTSQTTLAAILADLDAAAANDVANDIPDTGNPVKVGGRADTTVPAAVSADGDRVNAWFETHGALMVKQTDGTNVQVLNPCQGNTLVYTPISQTANTQLVTGTASKRLYPCMLVILPVADAESISLVAGTGTACATSTVAVIGGATAAAGGTLPTSGGFSLGTGGFAIGKTTVDADNLCLYQSGSGRVAGVLVSVAQ